MKPRKGWFQKFHSRDLKLVRTGPFIYGWAWAPPGTVWYISARRTRARHDMLIGLSRDWMRDFKIYMWSIHIGRLKLAFSRLPKGLR